MPQVSLTPELAQRRPERWERARDEAEQLAAHLPPGTARYGRECVAVEGDETGATVRFANGHTDSADVVIGADGIHSVVRTAVLGPEPPRYSGYTCWRGVCPMPAGVEPGYDGMVLDL